MEKAAVMYRETMEWRRSSNVGRLMKAHGDGGGGEDLYDNEKGVRRASNCGQGGVDQETWPWSRSTSTPEAALADKIGFFGRLSSPAAGGMPVAIWRLGAADLKATREKTGELLEAFACHLEDLTQFGRAESIKQKRQVRRGLRRHSDPIKPSKQP